MGHYRIIPEEQKKLVITMLDRLGGRTPADTENLNATGLNVPHLRTVQENERRGILT